MKSSINTFGFQEMEMFPLDGMEELAFSDISILLPVEEQWIQTKMDNKQSIEKRI